MTEVINEIPARIKNVAIGGHVCGTEDIIDDTKNKTQQQINNEVEQSLGSGGSVDERINNAKNDILGEASSDGNTLGKLENRLNPVEQSVDNIEEIIPSQATASNKLADKDFVNSSISTATAIFRGTSEAGLTESQFLSWANNLTKDLNDYVYWNTEDSNGNTQFKKYKYNGTQWVFEYTLNNSSFTADEWAAIQSGMTEVLKDKLVSLPTSSEINQAINNEAIARASGDSAINATIGTDSTSGTVKGRIKVLEDAVGTGGSIDSRIASAINTAKSEIKGSATTACDTLGEAEILINAAQNAISAETSRAQTAEQLLQEQYNALTQSDIIIGALPASGTKNKIYRVPGTTSYSDYMWDGSSFVKMAEYNNAIDDTPISGSNNIVKSTGIANKFSKTKNFIPGDTIQSLSELTASSTNLNSYIRNDGVVVLATSTTLFNVVTFDIPDNATILYVTGRVGSSTTFPGRCLYAFYNSNDDFIAFQEGIVDAYGNHTDVMVSVPVNAAKIKVAGHPDNGPASVTACIQKKLVSIIRLGSRSWYDSGNHSLYIDRAYIGYNNQGDVSNEAIDVNTKFDFTQENPLLVFNFVNKTFSLSDSVGANEQNVLQVTNYTLQLFRGALMESVMSLVINNYSKRKNIFPILKYGYVTLNGLFDVTDYEKRALCTPRYIKVTTGQVIFSVQRDCYIGLRKFDSDFNIIRDETTEVATEVTAQNEVSFPLSYEVSYIKFNIFEDSSASTPVSLQNVKLSGTIADDWDIYNERPTTGYHRIIVHPNVTNPSCCDETSSTVQDNEELLVDYGVIALPEIYTNVGEPTRLIIYCHGAAVYYSENVSDFDHRDLEPDYWLASGYAVMDVDGNPFVYTNRDDDHCSMPQSVDTYIAAYYWAIEHYNLKRDGIFLGGRSMGGGQTLSLIRQECPIPVIAACPNALAVIMPFGSNARRKTFWAEHCGFVLPSGFSFSDGWNENEKQVFIDNWDRWIKVVPLFTLTTDLPITDLEKEAFIDTMWASDKHTSEEKIQQRIDLFSSLHGHATCPIKIFTCVQDTGANDNAKYVNRMLLNGGSIVENREFTSNIEDPHHYDTQDPALRTNVTTRFGVEMTNVPIVYVEMLQFWRRYEQGN